jgi:AmmeMemoRadiSam system protein A
VKALSPAARSELLGIARRCLQAAVRGEPEAEVSSENPELQREGGCFVTYKTAGRLRGCIGCFESSAPIYRTVAEYARISALGDPRFVGNRIRPEELPDVDLEISVLSPRERIDDPLSIELGVHGIYIERGGRGGCFLPQVATEHNMTKEQFLSECSAGKAGLGPDAWRDPDTTVSVFTAEIISERE